MESKEDNGGPLRQSKKQFNGPCYVKICVNNILAGSIIGKSGSVIHGIEAETGCAMKLSPANCFFPSTAERLVVISGEQEQINMALLTVIEKLKNSLDEGVNLEAPNALQLRFVVPKSAVSGVIGKGGAQIKQLQEATNAKIQVSNREEGLNERTLTISGGFEPLQRAALAVAATIQSDPNLKDHLYVVYTPSNTPALAQGPGYSGPPYGPPPSYMQPSPPNFFPPPMPENPTRGMGYRQNGAGGMGQPSGAPVSLPRPFSPQSPPRTFQGAPAPFMGPSGPMLPGSPSSAATSDLMSHTCEIVLQIPDSSVGAVIGKNGVCLSDIIYSSGAKIRISQKGDLVEGTQNRRCAIKGTVGAVHAAHIMLLQRMEAAESQQQAEGREGWM